MHHIIFPRFRRSFKWSNRLDIERILAFHEIGRIDPVEYIDDWESVLNHAIKVRSEYGG